MVGWAKGHRMVSKLLSTAALIGALACSAAAPATADPAPTPPPYCAGNDPGDLLNGVSCDDQPTTANETPDPRPSNPPPGGNLPGGGPGGGGPGPGGGPGGNDASG
jgi:hypothetical protein